MICYIYLFFYLFFIFLLFGWGTRSSPSLSLSLVLSFSSPQRPPHAAITAPPPLRLICLFILFSHWVFWWLTSVLVFFFFLMKTNAWGMEDGGGKGGRSGKKGIFFILYLYFGHAVSIMSINPFDFNGRGHRSFSCCVRSPSRTRICRISKVFYFLKSWIHWKPVESDENSVFSRVVRFFFTEFNTVLHSSSTSSFRWCLPIKKRSSRRSRTNSSCFLRRVDEYRATPTLIWFLAIFVGFYP